MEKEGSLRDYMERIKALCRKSPKTAPTGFSQTFVGEPSGSSINPYTQTYVQPYVEPLPTPVTASTTTSTTPFSFEPDNAWQTLSVPTAYNATPNTFNPVQLQTMPTPDLTNDEWLNPPTTSPATTLFPSQTQQMLQQPWNSLNPYNPMYGNQPAPLSSCLESMIPINEADRPLLNHFVDNVIPLVFPMSKALQADPGRTREILSSVKTNRSYMHCCLSVSAIHLKTSMGMEDEMDHDIVKHRYEAICQLTRAHKRSTSDSNSSSSSNTQNQLEAMDATLAMIFYNCSVGTSDDYLPDIAWHAHFKGVSNLVKNLHYAPSSLNVSLIAWIDILGATMLGETPQFAHTYRTKHLRGVSSGLQPLMGCDDRIMYLISEIACLESLKNEGQLDHLSIYNHVNALSAQLDWTEPPSQTLEGQGPDGIDSLVQTVTSLFRAAARIYLYSLLATFNPYDQSITTLVASVTESLAYLPAGSHGLDRALVWPLFIAGAHSVPASLFRRIMADRVAALGYLGDFGSFGRMYRVLKAVWRAADSAPSSPAETVAWGDPQAQFQARFQPQAQAQMQPQAPMQPHWRDVMKQNKWEYLLM